MAIAATLLDNRYLLDEEIGAGGFCRVWRATDNVLTRPVAVKLLHAGHAHQPEARARFKAEARRAGAMSHENIAHVYDYGEPADGPAYLVMELIGGPSLARLLAGGPLDAARTMDIVAQVAVGLQAAHDAGLIHRDIKPARTRPAPHPQSRPAPPQGPSRSWERPRPPERPGTMEPPRTRPGEQPGRSRGARLPTERGHMLN